MAELSDREIFRRYERIRLSGKYNMITEADKAMKEANLRPNDYYYVMFNYDLLNRKYGDKNVETKNDKR